MRIVGEEEGGRPTWALVGLMGVVAGIIILSFYAVIAGWSLSYIGHAAMNRFSGAGAEEVNGLFGGMLGDWRVLAFWHTVFMCMTVFVVARGVERGLERAVRFLMPALAVLMFTLLGYAIIHGDFRGGVSFLLEADFSQLTGAGMLAALGQAFFSLSIGMGAIMAYGAYLPEGTSIGTTSASVVVADTGMALLAGLAIFPIVFAHGLDPAAGPGLIFQTLPLAFGNMAGGHLFGTLFFVLLTFAAWTSSIGLVEPAVAWSVETFGRSRRIAAVVIGLLIWALGFLTILSFNELETFKLLGRTLFENLDHLASNILLPLGGLFITIFAGWVMCKTSTADELDIGTGAMYGWWRFLARWVAPSAVLLVFLHATGLLDLLGLASG
jgi:neurotransmitter:Na+ symporter, NSS family